MSEEPDLLKQSQRSNYGLRSLFFYRKLQEGRFAELFETIAQLDPSKLDFSDRK
ncbi:MAG: hypothetical protein M1343_11585 [Chloroflexi bacterium]|nr:hypothetical protein [Chloroflexota bacterium]